MTGEATLDSKTVVMHREGAVMRITMSRPARLNAWSPPLVAELSGALEAAADDSVRAVVVTGAGRAFSSGLDLKGALAAGPGAAPSDLAQIIRERFNPLILSVRRLRKPVIAALNGPAVGISCGFALACDLIWAAESAYLMLPFTKIGLIPDGGTTHTVAASAGTARASEMALLCQPVPAAQALEWGLVNRVVPDGELEGVTDALAHRLADGPTQAFALTKEALNRTAFAGLEEQLDLEAELQGRAGTTQDVIEGISAFVQKREPRFQGR